MGTKTSYSLEYLQKLLEDSDDDGEGQNENVPAKRPRLSQLLFHRSTPATSSSFMSNTTAGPSTSRNLVSSPATATSTTAADTVKKASLPATAKPLFLCRNHIGYKILKNGGTINDVKDTVSMITQPGWTRIKNGSKRKHDPKQRLMKIVDRLANDLSFDEKFLSFDEISDDMEIDMVKMTEIMETVVLADTDNNAIGYDIDPLCKEKMLLFCNSPQKQQNDKRKKTSMPHNASQSHNQSAQAAKIFKCLICPKTFCNYDHLKFHLEQAYPSFAFTFSSTVIKVSLASSHGSSGKLIKGQAEQFIKNAMDLPACTDPYLSLPHAVQPSTYAFAYSSRYSDNVPSLNRHPSPQPKSKRPNPNLDVYIHLVPLHAINQTIENLLHEFEDIEEPEKKFMYLWNTFNYQQAQYGMIIMYKRLLQFIQEYYAVIEKLKLRDHWDALLVNFKSCKILNKDQFLALSLYRTSMENEWYGDKSLKLEVRRIQTEPPKKTKRRRKGRRT